jgi:beta-lactamase regulating signal transducer with metallopeptidase domain
MTAALALLTFLAEWSIRWGLVLGALAVWFALRPPRLAATRHALCLAALAAGLLLPILPRWAALSMTLAAPPPTIRSAPLPADPPPSTITTTAFLPAKDSPAATVVAPPAPPAIPWRVDFLALLVLTLALGWTTGAAYHLARLAAGWLVLARLRRTAVPVDADQAAILADALRSLGLRRRVGLAMHPTISSPVTLGGFRPLVLVPADWPGWPEPRRRAALLHELSHLSRRDDWAKLAQEILRTPLFFHPLVLWLLARLDRERELLCDEAVVSLGSDPVDYARLLLDLSRRPCRLLPTGLPFLDRRTVASRIHLLLEDGMNLDLPRPSPRRLLLLGALALSVSLGLGSLRVRSAEPAARQEGPAPAPKEPASTERIVSGFVVDTEGRPVADATVVAGSRDAGEPNHQILTTDGAGRFSCLLPGWPSSLMLLAHKTGFAVSSHEVHGPGETKLILRSPAPFTATMLDPEGRPLAGAHVRCQIGATQTIWPDGPNVRTTIVYERYPEAVYANSPLEAVLTATTDARGSFTVTGLPDGLFPRFAVTAADGRKLCIEPIKLTEFDFRVNDGFLERSPEPGPVLGTTPAGRIEGRVVAGAPGIEVEGLLVSCGGLSAMRHPDNPNRNFGATSLTDADGRFTFDGLEAGDLGLYVSPGRSSAKIPWVFNTAQITGLEPGQTRPIAIELIPGVEVTGTVVSRVDGRPLGGAEVLIQGPSYTENTGRGPISADAEGRFRVLLPPGPTRFQGQGPVSPLPLDRLPGSSHTVDIPKGVARLELPPIQITPNLPISGTVHGPDGVPVPDATVTLLKPSVVFELEGKSKAQTDRQGAFRMGESISSCLPFGAPAFLSVHLVDGTEHVLNVDPDDDGFYPVVLPR